MALKLNLIGKLATNFLTSFLARYIISQVYDAIHIVTTIAVVVTTISVRTLNINSNQSQIEITPNISIKFSFS